MSSPSPIKSIHHLTSMLDIVKEGVFSIKELEMMEGDLPKRATSLVLEWAFLHRRELEEDWQLATESKPLKKIKPLD